MDIVTLKASKRRTSSRRHTTDVTLDQLPRRNSITPLSSNSSTLGVDFYGGDSLSQGSSVFSGGHDFSKSTLASSWNDVHGEEGDYFETSSEVSDMPYYMGSQSDVFQELHELELQNHHIHDIQHTHQYQLSYELALDNMLTPFSSHAIPPLPQPTSKPLSHISHVIQEIVTTERNYVKYLSEIIEGYIVPMETRVGVLSMRESHLVSLFGNINEIWNFNKSLLEALLSCGHDAKKVGQCFLDKAEGFKIYSQYCTNYPNSVKVLADLSKDPGVARFLKICQQRLNHMLPLGAFLLKPVQRVLKYSLLLQDMAKHMKRTHDGFEVVYKALKEMTEVAEHINDMKKKYDAAVHVQEIQSLIRGWEEFDLSKYGDLVLEENFRYLSGRSSGPTFRTSRTDRYLFLFQKLCLMTKKEEYGYQYKTHLEMKDIQLTERIEKDRNCFQIRQVSTGRFFTLQARGLHVKELWVRTIKLLLMESIPHLPDKAKLLILAGFPTELAEVTRRSPTRQRHQSDEPQPSPQKGDRSSGRPRGLSKTIGRPLKPVGQDKPSLKNNRQRSHTSPNLPRIHVASPTHLLAQAGLTGYLTATVHTPPDLSRSPEEEEEDEEEEIITENDESYLNAGQRDSGFSELIPGSTYDSAHRQGRAGKSPLADIRQPPPPLRERENRDKPKLNFSPQLKKYKSSTDEPNNLRGSPKAAFPRHTTRSQSATPEHFGICSQNQFQPVEQSYSDSPSGRPQIMQSAVNYVREVPIRNVKPTGSVREPAESSELILPNDRDRLEHTGSSSSAEHMFSRFSELDNESPPMSPIRLTRIDSVGSEGLEHEPSAQPQFASEVVDPPSMFSGNVGEVVPQPDIVPHCSESNVTVEEEDLFNELMKSDSELPCPQSEYLENVCDNPGSSLSRNGEDIVKSVFEHFPKSASPVDGDEWTKRKPSEEIHSFPLERVLNVEATTPKASPLAIHRRTVKSQLSPDSDDLQVTPTASPHVKKHVTSGKGVSSSESSFEDVSLIIEPPFEFKGGKMSLESSPGTESPMLPIPPDFDDELRPVIQKAEPLLTMHKTAVRRRHSFGSRTRSMFIHKTDGSHSDGNSPNGSPAMQPGKNVTKDPQRSSTISVLRRHHSDVHKTKKRPISVLGLISTTRSDLSLEDLPSVCNRPDTDLLVPSDSILPPPKQFEEPISVPEQQNKTCSSRRRKYDSLFRNLPHESPIAQSQSGSTQPSPAKVKRSDDQSLKPLLWFQRHRKTSKPSRSSSQVISRNEKTKNSQEQGHEQPPVFVPEMRENTSREPITVIPPYDDNPEESLSFDEILASFDHYASATGNTTKKRSRGKEKMRLPSPEPKPRNKMHKRRQPRYLTISSIDADTIKAVEEALQKKESPPPPRPRVNTKVHQMAREYSRRIKDHQRRGIFKRYSTVVEEPPELSSESPIVTKGPIWLENLKERRSRTLSQSSQEEPLSPLFEPTKSELVTIPSDLPKTDYTSPHLSRDDKHTSYSRVQVEISPKLQMLDTPEVSSRRSSKSTAQSHTHWPTSSMDSGAQLRSSKSREQSHTDWPTANKDSGAHNKVNFDETEFHRKGGFRGWVKSLVDKFSGSSKDKK